MKIIATGTRKNTGLYVMDIAATLPKYKASIIQPATNAIKSIPFLKSSINSIKRNDNGESAGAAVLIGRATESIVHSKLKRNIKNGPFQGENYS